MEWRVVDSITMWSAFPFTISCKGIHIESHDWWAPIMFSLKETRTRVRHVFLLHHSVGGQYTMTRQRYCSKFLRYWSYTIIGYMRNAFMFDINQRGESLYEEV